MAQIKVLDLNDSNSLFELSYEDAKKVSGGLLGIAGIEAIRGFSVARGNGAPLRDSLISGGLNGILALGITAASAPVGWAASLSS